MMGGQLLILNSAIDAIQVQDSYLNTHNSHRSLPILIIIITNLFSLRGSHEGTPTERNWFILLTHCS